LLCSYRLFDNQPLYYTPTRREGAILQSPCPSVRLSIRSHFRNRYLSFYWKKWLLIYFLFTVRLTNERVGVFLARRSVQHLVYDCICISNSPNDRIQSVPITTNVVSSNPVNGEVYSIQQYVIKFVNDLRHIGGFLRVLWFPPPIKLTTWI
jgi:hypothetical protein